MVLLLLWLWLNILLLSWGERPSQHRHGKLGSLQFGSRRGSRDGTAGGAGEGESLFAAVIRVLLVLGLTGLKAAEGAVLGALAFGW